MGETLTIEKFKEAGDVVEKIEKEDEEKDLLKGSKKPPKNGPCKGCGKDRPLNRLFLCYPCWVKAENEKGGWREGQPHPDGCGCDLDCKLDSQGGQN